MHQDKYVFSQLVSFLDRSKFNRIVAKDDGDKYVKHFTCWNQLLALMFGQLSNRESLRDLIIALEAHQGKTYHLSLGKNVTRSNLSKANKNRDYHIFESFAYYMVEQAQKKRKTNIFNLGGSVYAFDSTTIAMDLSPLQIAEFYKNRWQIELFFKWLKQHLKIKKFWGDTENAVRIQIYSAIIVYCLVAIIQHDMKLGRSTYEILQILSISLTDKTRLRDLFNKTNFNNDKERCGYSEPSLFNF